MYHTDHFSTVWPQTLRTENAKASCWSLRVQVFKKHIVHKPGRSNLYAGALLRAPVFGAPPKNQEAVEFPILSVHQIKEISRRCNVKRVDIKEKQVMRKDNFILPIVWHQKGTDKFPTHRLKPSSNTFYMDGGALYYKMDVDGYCGELLVPLSFMHRNI